jgi:RNA polymerase sigma-70 factor (ECF subfamily)
VEAREDAAACWSIRISCKDFLREERWIAAYLLSSTGDIHAAEDLLQSIARILLEKWDAYDKSRPFGAWAAGMARLEVLKWRQQAARSRAVLSEESLRLLSETAAEHAEEIDQRRFFLAECLEALGATARRVLQMKYENGCKIAEISGQLKKSVPAVEMTLVRSRRCLRECIERKMSQAAREAL